MTNYYCGEFWADKTGNILNNPPNIITFTVVITNQNGKRASGLAEKIYLTSYPQEGVTEGSAFESNDDKGLYRITAAIDKEGKYVFEVHLEGEDLRVDLPVTISLVKTRKTTGHDVTGIFPRKNVGTTDYNLTENSAKIQTTPNCHALYYGNDCTHILDYQALNGIMSELGNLVNSAGLKYDCSRLDNLTRAVDIIARQANKEKYLIAKFNETSSDAVKSEKKQVFPYDVYPRYYLRQLYFDTLNNSVNHKLLEKSKLISGEFSLDYEGLVYFEMDARVWIDPLLPIENIGFILVSVDGNFNLYDSSSDSEQGRNYFSYRNLGTYTAYEQDYHGKTEPWSLSAGKHKVEVFLIQFNDVEFPTDIKQRDNFPKLRVNIDYPKVSLKVWDNH